jgi:hypothetical protein
MVGNVILGMRGSVKHRLAYNHYPCFFHEPPRAQALMHLRRSRRVI